MTSAEPNPPQSTPGVEDLVSRCSELGVGAANLDEVVRDVLHESASEAVNLSADFEDAYDRLHDAADRDAAEINNGGLRSQLLFLSEQWGASAVLEHLGHVAAWLPAEARDA